MASVADARRGALSFWQKMALGIAAFILFGFFQWTARGFVNIPAVPVWIHAHALVMVAWLALFVIQPTLVKRNALARHRQLGRIGIGLAALIVVLGSFSSIMAIRTAHVPPFFSPGYFLALTHVGLAAFVAMLVAAIVSRRDTQAHRRFIVGANVLLMEPAYGRLLPMPLLAPWGETVGMFIQLGTLALVARHDRATLGHVHRVTVIAMAVVVSYHALFEMLGRMPFVISLAEAIARG
jgi:hypothetical protein